MCNIAECSIGKSSLVLTIEVDLLSIAGRLGPGVNKKGLILINGRREKLAFGTSVR
jgi:hypothetical protein